MWKLTNSMLTPAAYPGERLTDRVYTYVEVELIRLRKFTEKKKLHNKLHITTTFAGGDHLTIVNFEIVVALGDPPVRLVYFRTIRIPGDTLLVRGAIVQMILRTICRGMVADKERFNAAMDKILNTFEPEPRVRVPALLRAV